jgi:hypothetical protein
MKYKFLTNSALSILIFFLFSHEAFSQPEYKEIKIAGTKIFTEEFLLQQINLNKLSAGNSQFPVVAAKITAYYHKAGYILAKVYPVEETDSALIVYVDEGRIGRIVFRRLNSFDTLKMKYEFELKYKVYNKFKVEKEIARLKKKYKFKDIMYSLVRAAEGDKALFQLDNNIQIPKFGTFKLPFFNDYSERYNLEIEFIPQNRDKTRSLDIGLKTSYSKGLIPEIEYFYPSFLIKKDLFVIGSSIGLYYGLDLKFRERPKWTFMEVHSDYHFAPMFRDYITPMASGSAYFSHASRPDIGLSNYNYLKLKGILAPGFTLLDRFRIYLGGGAEKVFIFTPETDTGSDYTADVEKHNDTWGIIESRIRLDIKPWTLKNTRKQQVEIKYNYYFNNKIFYELNIKWKGNVEFKNLNYFIFTMDYSKIWRKPPFYHEYPVAGDEFKGFMGKGFYTRNIFRSANEYKFSIYRDSYYAGIFTDLTRFEGSGYDLTGYQNGIVSGIAGHIIFLDQFEFNIFFGKDYLFSTKESQYNIFININKKW